MNVVNVYGLATDANRCFEAAAEMQQKAIELAPNDHRCWGRLAESSRFIDGAVELAADANIEPLLAPHRESTAQLVQALMNPEV